VKGRKSSSGRSKGSSVSRTPKRRPVKSSPGQKKPRSQVSTMRAKDLRKEGGGGAEPRPRRQTLEQEINSSDFVKRGLDRLVNLADYLPISSTVARQASWQPIVPRLLNGWWDWRRR
jgi:hypothetical protein